MINRLSSRLKPTEQMLALLSVFYGIENSVNKGVKGIKYPMVVQGEAEGGMGQPKTSLGPF